MSNLSSLKDHRPYVLRGGNSSIQPTPDFEYLINALKTVVLILDRFGLILYCNDTAASVLQWQPTKLVGCSIIELCDPVDREALRLYLDLIRQGKKVPTFEPTLFKQDRSPIPTSWMGKWDENKEWLIVSFRDITERQQKRNLQLQYERELEVQSQQMTEMMDRVTEAFYALDKDWNILFVNEVGARHVGKKRQEMVGKSLDIFVPTIKSSATGSKFREAIRLQQPLSFIQPSEISDKLLEFFVYPSSEGFTFYMRDVTEKIRREEEFRKLSLLARETKDSVAFISVDERITWVNHAFCGLMGYSFEELVGSNPTELLKGARTDVKTLRQITARFRAGQPFETEVINYTKNGEPVWVELQIQPLYDRKGKLKEFFSVRRDITERKRLEEELQHQQKKATAAVIDAQERERSQVGQELHDNVNQVLTSVKLYQELILSGMGDTRQLLQKSSDLLQNSINEIRSLSKRLSAPTLGKIRLKESLQELIETIAATNRFHISLKADKIITTDISQELHLGVYRIVQEHLTNILKHANAGNVTLHLRMIKSVLLLDVVDDGQGFDTSKKRAGIGITNMMARAESLGGSLYIRSTPGEGCILKACFPVTSS